uniref:FERM domain-containing protein 8 n=1 Tax=Anopheles minimus TaxID=112268 RepID=A0A182VZX2_9DIPT
MVESISNPGPSSNTSSGNYQLGPGNGNESLLHHANSSTATTINNTTTKQQQHLYNKQPQSQPHQQQQQQQQHQKQQQSTSSLTTGHNLLPGITSYPSSVASTSGLWSEDNPFSSGPSHHQLPPHSSGVNVNVTVNVVARSVTASTMTTTTATTTSTTTLAPPRPMQKVIPTVVYLMSRIAVHMEIEGTAQCPAQVMLAAALGCEELGITNKLLAQSVFGLWMTSPLLEVQLKPHHRPYAVRVAWSKLLDKHSHGNELEKLSDEPMTTLRRNVFFSRRDEEKIKDPRILELLYEEARHNVLLGRYVMEPSQSIMLGGIQARIELGPYNSHTHTTSYFRENQFRFLPAHVAKSSSWSWLPISQRSSAEVRLLEQFKRVPTTATTKKLMRKYLEFCWGLPFYGAAYFHGQVEQPVRGLMSLMQQKDLPVLIAVNERGIFVIDQIECVSCGMTDHAPASGRNTVLTIDCFPTQTLLLGLKYEEFSWEYAKPSNVNDPECLPCIFLQFGAVENGIAATKLMQIFSRQAAMVDALITHFVEQDKRRKESGAEADQAAGGLADNTYVEPNPIKNNGIGVLSNKFARLTLATFDDEGRCIGQTGSLSISY